MSFGNTLGRSIGKLGALTVEGAVRGATGLGQFGADVVDGAQAGYEEKHAALLVSRAAYDAKRAAAIAARKQQHALTMAVAPEPVAAAPTKRNAKV